VKHLFYSESAEEARFLVGKRLKKRGKENKAPVRGRHALFGVSNSLKKRQKNYVSLQDA
jgi:hypothetical protein